MNKLRPLVKHLDNQSFCLTLKKWHGLILWMKESGIGILDDFDMRVAFGYVGIIVPEMRLLSTIVISSSFFLMDRMWKRVWMDGVSGINEKGHCMNYLVLY